MKRLLLLSLLTNASLLAVLLAAPLAREPIARAAAGGVGGAVVAGNGDVNGSGAIDIADPVYLLNWLFSGGPGPVPFGGGGGLPDTGQEECFDCDGNLILCNSCAGKPRPCDGFTDPTFSIQDSLQHTGCPDDSERFTINIDDTVTDNCTGLQWQRFPADADGDGSADGFTWCGALRFCNTLSHAGHQDWRLPNVRELQSILDYGRAEPAIANSFVSVSGDFWSSTTDVSIPRRAWAVDFRRGVVRSDIEKDSVGALVRAVRDAR
jgi:hypothetical protein